MAMATLLHWIQVASILLGKMPPSLDGELLMTMVSSIKMGIRVVIIHVDVQNFKRGPGVVRC